MREITKYRTVDGLEFEDRSAAEEYERLHEATDAIMSALPKRPDQTKYLNGSGFIQHDQAQLSAVRRNLLDLISTKVDHRWVEESRNPEIHPSWVARLVGDSSYRCLSRAWNRFMCIDKHGREWGQPYFANNPEKADDPVCLNRA